MTLRIAIEEALVTSEIAAEWKKVLAGEKCEPGFRKMGETIFAQSPGNSLLHDRLLDIALLELRIWTASASACRCFP